MLHRFFIDVLIKRDKNRIKVISLISTRKTRRGVDTLLFLVIFQHILIEEKYFSLSQELDTGRLAWLDVNQDNLHLDFDVPSEGPYIMIITYHTPENGQGTRASVEITSEGGQTDKGSATFYECSYSFLCRQVVIDQYGQVSKFQMEPEQVKAIIELEEEGNLGVDNVALVPAYLWTMDYITPQSECVKRDGSCTESEYTVPPESIKVRVYFISLFLKDLFFQNYFSPYFRKLFFFFLYIYV